VVSTDAEPDRLAPYPQLGDFLKLCFTPELAAEVTLWGKRNTNVEP
jgi:hypothetical protein